MRPVERIVVACAIAGFAVIAHGSDGNGLTVDSNNLNWPRWQGRLSLGNAAPPAWRSSPSAAVSANPGVASLSLMSDYYLTGSLLGPKRAGGFRATSGVMIGPRSQAWAGAVPGFQRGAFNVDRRLFGQPAAALPGDASTDSPTLPYVGVGYTGLSPRGGWSFSADLGLVPLKPGSAVKLGSGFTGPQSLDDTLREMRWSPMLQLGVSYSF